MDELETLFRKIGELAAGGLHQISQNPGVPNPTVKNSWDWIGLPDKLRDLANALSASGGTALDQD